MRKHGTVLLEEPTQQVKLPIDRCVDSSERIRQITIDRLGERASPTPDGERNRLPRRQQRERVSDDGVDRELLCKKIEHSGELGGMLDHQQELLGKLLVDLDFSPFRHLTTNSRALLVIGDLLGSRDPPADVPGDGLPALSDRVAHTLKKLNGVVHHARSSVGCGFVRAALHARPPLERFPGDRLVESDRIRQLVQELASKRGAGAGQSGQEDDALAHAAPQSSSTFSSSGRNASRSCRRSCLLAVSRAPSSIGVSSDTRSSAEVDPAGNRFFATPAVESHDFARPAVNCGTTARSRTRQSLEKRPALAPR